MATKTDYYALLGITKEATPDEIKKAYRKLAMQYHPDRNQGDKSAEEKFKQMSEAYAVLSDVDKRKKYDTFGSADAFSQNVSTDDIFKDFNLDDILSQFGMRNSGWGNFKGRRPAAGQPQAGGSVFDDLFGNVGGTVRDRVPKKGQDAELPLTVPFHDAMFGVERPIVLQIDGEERRLTVRIPPGIATGKKLRVKGEGHKAPGGRGDLHLLVTVEEDPRFERKGDDLHTTAHVTASTLILGGSADVETLHGRKRIKVSGGAPSGTQVRVRGQGAPVLGKAGTHGDLYVRLEVHLDGPLTDEQRAAVERLREVGL